MEDSQKVVYAAKNVQQAYLLKNTLEEMGISAVVANASLSGGSGVDYIGWNTLPRVVVDEIDYQNARRIALDFDHAGVAAAEEHMDDDRQSQDVQEQEAPEQETGETLHEWPCCPNCRAPRITQCPVCKTTGDDFPEADSEFVWGMGLNEIQEGDGHEEHEHDNEDADADEKLVLMCPTCDEPFLPEFPNRCAMCGQQFADGFEVELQSAPLEQHDSRVIALMIGLGVLLAVLVGYFMWVVR